MNRIRTGTCLVIAFVAFASGLCSADGPHQATGIKIGEVTDATAIVWTRLTLKPERNPADGPMVRFKYAGDDAPGGRKRPPARRTAVLGIVYPEGTTVADLRDAVPGAAGEVRVGHKARGRNTWAWSGWEPVDADKDFTRQFALKDLKSSTDYDVRVEGRPAGAAAASSTTMGRFRTAPARDVAERVVFTVSTGQGYRSRDCPEGFKIYAQMLKLKPSFFVHTGDLVYYDRLAKDIALARYHWQRTYSLPSNVPFHRQVASYFMKDDHDTWFDDAYPDMKLRAMFKFTFEQGQAVFLEQVPLAGKTYRTVRWGKDLQIWLVEGRDYRSRNTMRDGPEKTIWGKEQKAWFKRTVQASDATFRVLISPTPIVGPDRTRGKRDNHANKAFATEGKELRTFISKQANMVVVCGDRHWQYHSVDPETGLNEYSCGPVSHKHSGGYSMKDKKPMHKYLKIRGGFLAAIVDRADGKATLKFRFYSPDGGLYYELVRTAEVTQ